MLLGVAQQVREDRRHAAHQRGALRGDQAGERLGAQEAVRQDQVGAGERRAVRQPPRVDVEHRHDREHAVLASQTEPVAHERRRRMQADRAVRVEHPLGVARRPARVAERGGLALVELGVVEVPSPGRLEQISLSAQKGRDLQHVDDLSGRRTLFWRVHVGKHGQPCRLADASEGFESGVQPRTARRIPVGPVGLVEACLIDDAAGYFLGELRQGFADAQVELVALQHTGAGDQKEFVCRKEFRHAIPPLLGALACGCFGLAILPARPHR